MFEVRLPHTRPIFPFLVSDLFPDKRALLGVFALLDLSAPPKDVTAALAAAKRLLKRDLSEAGSSVVEGPMGGVPGWYLLLIWFGSVLLPVTVSEQLYYYF